MGADPPADELRLEPGMSGSIVANTALFALAHGLDEASLEAAAGLPVAELLVPDARFDDLVVGRIWRALSERHLGEALPLRMAEAAPTNFFGPMAYAARFTPNLREGLSTFIRFRALLSSSLRAELVEDAPEHGAALVVAHPSDPIDAGAGAEVGLAVGWRFVSEVLGMSEALAGVDFRHPARAPVAAYERFFAAPVRFAAPRTGLRFHPGALDTAPANHDPKLFAYIEGHLRLAAEALTLADELGDLRRTIAELAERQEYSAEALARAMGVSLRALQRRVASEGTTLRKLLDEARCAQAKALLDDRSLSVEEVAFILDYSDERAFRRAFKRMTGASPAQYRRAR
ncbi:AraC family transcriptional regulator ligand-binding domain-containing protein [Pseudenhygromyxa sp. WMMC2535]|uniref:AraC family transcriptional regulator n=1 Tax=Pseudenhygromyxa sp. WMMC2535 TaxID=2712867 RepID=UPI00155447C4|nr:AraC family transcriptional regulator [Pseudenhygromyxa sp. WMMC2535]NVB37664.1 AraC family transcriptional regulator ligand-binding domain-containing protein [Pseudenhygromyxa sp. WMMC2535]